MTFNSGKYLATGIMINPMVVLTAAHNLYDRKAKEYAKDLIFVPGKNSDSAQFGIY